MESISPRREASSYVIPSEPVRAKEESLLHDMKVNVQNDCDVHQAKKLQSPSMCSDRIFLNHQVEIPLSI